MGGWARSNLSDNQVIVGITDRSTWQDQWLCMFGPNRVAKALIKNGSTETVTTTAKASVDTWAHVCTKFVSDTSRFAYLNGTPSAESTTSVTVSGVDTIAIGARVNPSTAWHLSGAAEHVFIYNVALSDAEISALADGISPLLIRPESLVFYWRGDTAAAQNVIIGVNDAGTLPSTQVDGPGILLPSPPQLSGPPLTTATPESIESTFTVFTPTVTSGSEVKVEPPTVDMSTSIFTPTVSEIPISVPSRADWLSNATTFGATHEFSNIPPPDETGPWYYDGTHAFYQLADFTGNSSWNDAAQFHRDLYYTWAIDLDGSGGQSDRVQGWRVFPHGPYFDSTRNPSSAKRAESLDLINHLATKSAFAAAGGGESYSLIRETGYILNAYRLNNKIGNGEHANMSQTVGWLKGHLTQYADLYNTNPNEIKPWMGAGIACRALIDLYEDTDSSFFGDATLRTAVIDFITLLADDIELGADAHVYNSTTGHFIIGGGNGGDATDLNLMICPAFAWVWKETGTIRFQTHADDLFVTGVEDAFLGAGKQYSQNYFWSFFYVDTREEPSELTVDTVDMSTTVFTPNLLITNPQTATSTPITAETEVFTPTITAGPGLVSTDATPLEMSMMVFESIALGGSEQRVATGTVELDFSIFEPTVVALPALTSSGIVIKATHRDYEIKARHMGSLPIRAKQPSEIFTFDVSFDGELPSSTSLETASVTAIDLTDGSDASEDVLQDTNGVVIGSSVILVGVKGGEHGKDYKITIKAPLSPSGLVEQDFILEVRER